MSTTRRALLLIGSLMLCACGSSSQGGTGAQGNTASQGGAGNNAGNAGTFNANAGTLSGSAATDGGSTMGNAGSGTGTGGRGNAAGSNAGGNDAGGSAAVRDGGNGNPARPDAGEPIDDGTCTANRPCTDGVCMGDSCGGTWTCQPPQTGCTRDLAPYCGCDGAEFADSSTCPRRPYAHFGGCEPTEHLCDLSQVMCDALTPDCGPTLVPSVTGSCYGPCVPIDQCLCAEASDCPEPNTYTCHLFAGRCGPYVQ